MSEGTIKGALRATEAVRQRSRVLMYRVFPVLILLVVLASCRSVPLSGDEAFAMWSYIGAGVMFLMLQGLLSSGFQGTISCVNNVCTQYPL